ncbi:MAG TPA: LysM domain-containing protein, partial [Candidatus Limnocylindria bacterium]|nr:LysM domain-containing protein [Candidatus Limnocylindria bacterium]
MPHRPQVLVLSAAVLLGLLAAPLGATGAAASDRFVVVRPGQTLSGIAARAGVTVERLAQLNGLSNPNLIFAGQRLQIRGGADRRQRARPAPSAVRHTVAYGETLSGIALRYGITVIAIARANGVRNVSFIRAGDVLRIPGAAAAPGQRNGGPRSWGFHRVAYGETLWAIAGRYGTTVEALARANGIANGSLIRTGDLLRVPRGGSRPAAPRRGRNPAAPNVAMPSEMAALVAARRDVG